MAKKRTMNELRQTKEYQGSSEGSMDIPGNRKYLNDLDPVKQIMAQQIDEELEECPLDPVEEAKILIVDKITKHFHDVMFEMVNEEMGKNYVFQSQNYFTDAGYDQFEDEWFEFYHEHHGDIMCEVMQNITN